MGTIISLTAVRARKEAEQYVAIQRKKLTRDALVTAVRRKELADWMEREIPDPPCDVERSS